MERLRRLSIKTPGRITTISHHAGNKQGQSDILNFPQKGPIWSWKCAGEILPPNYWAGVCCFGFFLCSHLLNWWYFILKSDCLNLWQADWWHVGGSLELCSSWEKCVCDAGQKRPATSAVSGETINRYRETSKMFSWNVSVRCWYQGSISQ